MPNTSDVDRIMLACGYTARWYQCKGTVKVSHPYPFSADGSREWNRADMGQLPQGVEHLYESNDQVEVMAEYLPLEEYKKYRHKVMDDQFHTKLNLPSGIGLAA